MCFGFCFCWNSEPDETCKLNSPLNAGQLLAVIQGNKALDVMGKLMWCTNCINSVTPPADATATLLGPKFSSSMSAFFDAAFQDGILPDNLIDSTKNLYIAYLRANELAPLNTCLNLNPSDPEWCNTCSVADHFPCTPITFDAFREQWINRWQVGPMASALLADYIPSMSNCPIYFPDINSVCSPLDSVLSSAFLEVIQGAKGLAVMASLKCATCYQLITKNDLLGATFDASMVIVDDNQLDLPVPVTVKFGTFFKAYNNTIAAFPLDKPCAPNCPAFLAAWTIVGNAASDFLATIDPSLPSGICKLNLDYSA